ncbi:hypothetical protein Osc7112_6840 (plasmid) [Oscillatoria nigro-viridis PCC 7112]|uniref:Uncharacterized protein n=1 Tax=Phormidium nigroviride PCC 7112 TaxID=179408 RepID=K9VUQ8_9CYAN|nr:hypothetical protein Osc7112_6840 [Oscillatoria nigro-viridis PCC 7112]
MRCIVFVSARKNLVCDHKTIACYRLRTAITSPNRSRHEQHKKGSNLTEKFRRKAGYFQVNTGKMQSLQIPAFRLILYCFPSDFIRHLPDLRAHQKSANFFGGGFDQRCESRTDKSAGGRSSCRIKPIAWLIPCQHGEIKKWGNDRQSA